MNEMICFNELIEGEEFSGWVGQDALDELRNAALTAVRCINKYKGCVWTVAYQPSGDPVVAVWRSGTCHVPPAIVTIILYVGIQKAFEFLKVNGMAYPVSAEAYLHSIIEGELQ